MRALGVDVGGKDRKDLDVVLLDGDRQVLAVGSRVPVSRLGALLADHRPDIVCIDSPPAWAPAGARSRLAERELKLVGIQAYYTPDKTSGEESAFYDWMRNGMAAFSAAERAGFGRYRAGALARHAVEVFPHASATVLAGCLAPAGQRASAKRTWRAAVLTAQHVPIRQLQTLDQVDAALCALTGIIALEIGDPFAPGASDEGRIVLPARVVPASGYRRCVPASTPMQPLIKVCACGCGNEIRSGRDFRPGHDRKLMVQLQRAVADGDRAPAELDRRGWT